ncbi:sugar ABC transporter substrate-binding protein [Conexibacter arvalis]|uniref:ABC-type sugar transport system substrate-binding protein n=1 Tax=Conexibacter arvalis TaxID=912552 RepID=A0A840ID75_9ACTN|nr:sugar ABC transporter substrate-binding protein [Conexibacter arvalis]MBB4662183.1 ABC-type sugar transport system substrate-binding protein [Conexibacter arvalis]
MHRIAPDWAKRAFALLIAAVAAVALAACGSSDDDAAATAAAPATPAAGGGDGAARVADVVYDGPEADLPTSFPEPEIRAGFRFTIGFPNPSTAVPSLVAQEEAVRDEVARLGGRVIATDAQFSVQKQVSDVEQLLAQRVDAIVLSALDPNSLTPLLDKARAQGTLVFVNDVPYRADLPFQEGFAGEIFSGTDKSAYDRAKLLAETQPGATYALIGLGIPAPMLDYKVRQVRYWGDRFGLRYVDRVDARVDTPEAGAEAGTALFAKHRDLDAVFTATDSLSVGVSTAARTSGQDAVKIIGNGGYRPALEGVKRGDLFATYWSSPHELHRQLVWAAYNALTGQHADQPRQVVLSGGRVITRANADSIEDPVG